MAVLVWLCKCRWGQLWGVRVARCGVGWSVGVWGRRGWVVAVGLRGMQEVLVQLRGGGSRGA